MKRDKHGHRDYSIEWLVEVTDVNDGPVIVMEAFGLPRVGNPWVFGNELDPWAFCHPDWVVTPRYRDQPGDQWVVEQVFSTRPLRRCQDETIQDPLMEPPRVRGKFSRYQRAPTKDRHGKAIQSSSLERYKGPEVEFDHNRPGVTIEITSLFLPNVVFSQVIDSVNDREMWGNPYRTVKLSDISWQRLLYGTCSYYFVVTYDFEIRRGDDGWDPDLVDEGTRYLKPWLDPDAPDGYGTAATNKDNPKNFIQCADDVGNVIPKCQLNGKGQQIGEKDSQNFIRVEYYPEFNFYELGVPTNLDI
jgi:hypothetical protein